MRSKMLGGIHVGVQHCEYAYFALGWSIENQVLLHGDAAHILAQIWPFAAKLRKATEFLKSGI